MWITTNGEYERVRAWILHDSTDVTVYTHDEIDATSIPALQVRKGIDVAIHNVQ